MFVIALQYKKPLTIVEQYLNEHKQFLDEGYKRNYFIVSGPKNPREGGVIISHIKNRSQLEEVLKQDPFYIHEVAEYQITEFIPTKYHTNFSHFIES